MKLSGSFLLVITCVIYVLGSLVCPKNCKVVKKQATCKESGLCLNGCNHGHFGDRCDNNCHYLCRNGSCQQRSGICLCKRGYRFHTGVCILNKGVLCKSNEHCLNDTCISPGREECLKGCNQGRYGSSCQHNCQGHCICDQDSGNCTECSSGWYGSECASQCSSGCKNNNCQRDGSCFQCNSGWYGGKCNMKCSRHCLSGCGQSNGDCIAGCKSGWYGDECNMKCSLNCLSGCYQSNESCTEGCNSGWHGDKCTIECSEHCVSGCDQVTGDCDQCEAGRYGSTCESECSAGCTDCERDGSCPKGCIKGDKCTEPCKTCTDGICDKMTGACTKGCVSDFYGEFCDLTCDSCTDGNCGGKCTATREGQWVPYTIAGGLFLTILVLTGFFIFCLKRMRDIVRDGMESVDKNTSVRLLRNLGSLATSNADDDTNGRARFGTSNRNESRMSSNYNHLFDIRPAEPCFSLANDDLETASGYCSVLPMFRGQTGDDTNAGIGESDGERNVISVVDLDEEGACGGVEAQNTEDQEPGLDGNEAEDIAKMTESSEEGACGGVRIETDENDTEADEAADGFPSLTVGILEAETEDLSQDSSTLQLPLKTVEVSAFRDERTRKISDSGLRSSTKGEHAKKYVEIIVLKT